MSVRARLALGLYALALALAFGNALRGWNLRTDFTDFRATYCGARVLSYDGDPNLVEPLRACERAIDGTGDFARSGMLVPSAAPSYVLAAFGPLASLPYPLAAALYAALLLACVAATIILAVRMLGVSPLFATLAIGLSDGVTGIARGSLMPLCVLCVAVCAWSLTRRRPASAALAAAGALIVPPVGIALGASLFAFFPPTRRALLLGVALLGAFAFAVAGLGQNLEFLTRTLPLQAHAEVAAAGQYGAGYFIREVGFSDRTAAAASVVLWAALAVAGMWVARRLVQRFATIELLALLPPAFAVAATSVHADGFALAVLALLALMPNLDGVYVRTAIGLCAIPWSLRANDPWALAAAVGVAAAGLAFVPGSKRLLYAPLTAAVAAAAFVLSLQSFPPEDGPPARLIALPANAFAMEQWDRVVRARSDDDAYWLLLKLPTWTGFALLFGSALGAAQAERRRSVAVVARA